MKFSHPSSSHFFDRLESPPSSCTFRPSSTFCDLNDFRIRPIRFVPLPSSIFRLFSRMSSSVRAIHLPTPIRPLGSIGCCIRLICGSSSLTASWTRRFLARPSGMSHVHVRRPRHLPVFLRPICLLPSMTQMRSSFETVCGLF
jgi:hypothetical protein